MLRANRKVNLKSRTATTSIGVAAATILLAACGSSSASTASSSTAASSTPLYLWSSEGYDSSVCTAFQKATGIVCKLSDNSTGPTLAKIQATKNNPTWGVAWTDGNAEYASLDQQGMLLKNFQPNTGTLNSLGQKLVPADQSYIITGVTTTGAFVYDSSKVQNPPTSWQQLLQPQWKGKFGMNNPTIDGPSYPILAGLFDSLGGATQGEAFMSQLKANGMVVSQNSIMDDMTAGKVEIAIGQNTSGIGRAQTNHNIKVIYPNPSPALPSVLAIDGKASSAEIKDAKAFANFVYGPAGQKAMLAGDPTGDSQFFPVVNGTQAEAQVPAESSINFYFFDPYKWGSLESSINTWFSSNIA